MWLGVYVAWVVCMAISAHPLPSSPYDGSQTLAFLQFLHGKQELIRGLTNEIEQQTRLLEETKLEIKERTAEILNITRTAVHLSTKVRDCKVLRDQGYDEDGEYMIWPLGVEEEGVEAWCDMNTEGGGWTVFLKRESLDPPQDFAQPWRAYVDGFGNASGEYWLGNKYLHALTKDRQQVLRMDMEKMGDENGTRFAEWNNFTVGDEDSKFILQAENFTGSDPGNKTGNVLIFQTGHKFSTIDEDNDNFSWGSCSSGWGGRGGWWYGACGDIFPTAPLNDGTQTFGRAPGPTDAHSFYWGGRWDSKKAVIWGLHMKIREL